MEYCSIDDAFPQIGGGPASTGCKGNTAGSIARKEERKKAKKCKGPPLTFLEGSGDMPLTDPDRLYLPTGDKATLQNTGTILNRPALIPLPETPPLNRSTGLIQHAPVDAPPAEPFEDMMTSSQQTLRNSRGVSEDMSPETQAEMAASFRSEQPLPELQAIYNKLPDLTSIAGPNKAMKAKLPKYFGANYDDENAKGIISDDDAVEEGFASYTNVIGDDPAYRLSPDFTSAFAGKGVNRASGTDVLPIPSVKNVWKPLTPSGAPTAFFNRLPSPGGDIPIGQTSFIGDKEELFRKLDSIYARLDDLESRRSENAQTETLLFITSGIFILFSMDLLVKRTGNIRILNT